MASGLALALLAACSGEERVRVRTDHATYRTADVVVITTMNGRREAVYDNHCGGEVQNRDRRGRWGANVGMVRLCTEDGAPVVTISPGARHVDTLSVNGQAPRGTGRAVLVLRDARGRPLPEEERTSNTFRVRPR